MSRKLCFYALLTVMVPFGSFGEGHTTCEKMQEIKDTVSVDVSLSEEQKSRLGAKLAEADASCKEDKPEEAERTLRQSDDQWASDYFGNLMKTGH